MNWHRELTVIRTGMPRREKELWKKTLAMKQGGGEEKEESEEDGRSEPGELAKMKVRGRTNTNDNTKYDKMAFISNSRHPVFQKPNDPSVTKTVHHVTITASFAEDLWT